MKRLDSSELRALCIRNNWFTCGDIRQYTRFFQRNSEGATIDELSVIIWICSDDIPYNDMRSARLWMPYRRKKSKSSVPDSGF